MRIVNHDTTVVGPMVVVGVVCPECKKLHKLIVNHRDYLGWDRGELKIQDAFPRLGPAERELLLTGIDQECWDRLFGGEEDEE